MNELDDLLTAAGVSVTADSNPADPEAQKMFKELLKESYSKLAEKKAATDDIKNRYAQHRNSQLDHITSSKTRVRQAQDARRNLFEENISESEIVSIAQSKDELGKYFGTRADPRAANALSKRSYAAYTFLRDEARRQGVTR